MNTEIKPMDDEIYISPSGERLSICIKGERKLYTRDDAVQSIIDNVLKERENKVQSNAGNVWVNCPENPKIEKTEMFVCMIEKRGDGKVSVKPAYASFDGYNWHTEEGWKVIQWLDETPITPIKSNEKCPKCGDLPFIDCDCVKEEIAELKNKKSNDVGDERFERVFNQNEARRKEIDKLIIENGNLIVEIETLKQKSIDIGDVEKAAEKYVSGLNLVETGAMNDAGRDFKAGAEFIINKIKNNR